MPMELDAIEGRVLGALVEKSLTTPEQYPLTFNALLNACNQKTSREPVMNLSPDAMDEGVSKLLAKNLVERRSGSRVPKFLHHFDKLIESESPPMTAALCVLLLRGPQTPGEIKTRCERMFHFANTAEVEGLLQDLSTRQEGAFVARLPRQPGQKEKRYQHLFSGAPAPGHSAPSDEPEHASTDRMASLEARVEALEAVCKSLQEKLETPAEV